MAVCVLSLCLCLWMLLCSPATGFLGFRGPTHYYSRLLMLQMAKDDYMSFGNRMEINIKLPTREKEIAQLFLKNPKYILEQTWESGKFLQLSEKTYMLKTNPFPIPGIDTITPEIEVDFVYDNGVIRMSSGNWTLRGTSGGIVKDSRFMQSFTISLIGQLGLANMDISNSTYESLPPSLLPSSNDKMVGSSSIITAKGWVEYTVEGEKPNIFKAAPSFVLDATIKLIKDSVNEFATLHFSAKLLRAFRMFLLASKSKVGR